VTLRLAPHFVLLAQYYLGEQTRAMIEHASLDEQGRVQVVASFESLEEARTRCLSLGRAVEVLEPEALRKSVIDYAEQLGKVYAKTS